MNRSHLTVVALLAAHTLTAAAWGQASTAFTYQGRLDAQGAPASGVFDMQFGLYATEVSPTPLASRCVNNVTVVDGVFTVSLDFGAEASIPFGDAVLGIRVRADGPDNPCDPNDATYTTLTPRQPVTAAPLAASLRNVFVDAAGRVGVASSSPLGRLEVQGGANADGSMDPAGVALAWQGGGFRHFMRSRHDGTAGGGNAIEFFVNSSPLADGSASPGVGNVLPLALSGAGSGSVGIRNSNPTAPLSVTAFNGSGRNDLVTLRNTSNADRWLLRLNNNDLVFRDSSTDRVTFSASGLVGIGNIDPTAPLTISGRFGGPLSSDALVSFRRATGGELWNVNLKGSSLTFWDTPAGLARVTMGQTNAEALRVIGTVTCGILTITGGSDIAEPFNVAADGAIEPGMVVSIDPAGNGGLRVASAAYDHGVVGIISGANGVNPGLTLTQQGTIADGQHPVALTGRVWVRADAADGPIVAGDLLTTSARPGHAMKAADRERSYGATIGKAMTSLDSGTGYVLVLVNLQ